MQEKFFPTHLANVPELVVVFLFFFFLVMKGFILRG